MVITETCIGDKAEFSIDNPDEQVCKEAYNGFLRDHRYHKGHRARMATAISILRTMTIPKIVKT